MANNHSPLLHRSYASAQNDSLQLGSIGAYFSYKLTVAQENRDALSVESEQSGIRINITPLKFDTLPREDFANEPFHDMAKVTLLTRYKLVKILTLPHSHSMVAGGLLVMS